MRFFTAATTALLFSAQALAGITQYTLSIEADDERVNGKGITFKHEGAGINYALLVTVLPNSTMMMNPNFSTIQSVHNLTTTLVPLVTLSNFPSLLHLLLKSVMMVL